MKKIVKMSVSAMIALATFTSSVAICANAEESETGKLELVTYDYVSKTETTSEVSIDMLQTENEEKLDTLGISEETANAAFDPNALLSSDSSNNSISTQSIIGDDDQKKVNPNVYPYCAVLALMLGQDTNGDGVVDSWGLGTGFLEGNDVMVTAGHCFWGGTTNGWVEECRIYVRQNSSTYGNVYYYPASWVCSTAYTSNRNINYDWCAVRLQDNLGAANGWFGKGVSSGSLKGTEVTISGYPAATSSKVGYQYTSSGTITSSTDYRVGYSIDTEGGNSGFPVYDSNGIVWAIHTHGGNSGTRISSGLYQILQDMYLEGVEKWS